jgi:hypothetical protein
MRDRVNLLTGCRYPIRKVGKKSLAAAAEQAFDERIAAATDPGPAAAPLAQCKIPAGV